ncbi:MAG: M28 family peptidase [Fimbriimonadaceae bacterium]|nr:M28 family peptidase [Fimbriimonadaceae bacterium]
MASGSASRLALTALLLALAPLAAGPAEVAAGVSPTLLREYQQRFCNIAPRAPGASGGQGAAAMIEARFRELGLQSVVRQRFLLPVPQSQGAWLTLAGQRLPLGTLAPNLVRLSALPVGGLAGPVVDAVDGDLGRYRGRNLDGAIVLVAADCGQRWLDAALLGAGAVVFVETAHAGRGELSTKVLNTPVDVPRFWLSQAVAAALLANGPRGRELGRGQIQAAADWRMVEGNNILGFLPGRDETLRRECLIVTAYYDSSSVVLEAAPGAEQLGGLAALLEAARLLFEHQPARTVLFVALDAHHQALAGARAFANVLRREHPRDRWPQAWPQIDAANRALVTELQQLQQAAEPRLAAAELAIWRQELAVQQAIAQQDAELASEFYANFDYTLSIALDLSSGSNRLGIFHAGHFYGDNSLLRFLSPLGKRFVGYGGSAGLPGAVVDCVNPAQDRAWDSWVPDQFASDAEPLVQAGRPAVTLFTIEDSRPRVDTPSDRPEFLNQANLLRQTQAVCAVLAAAADDRGLVSDGLRRVKRLPYKYQPLAGMIYEFERKKTFLPNTPVPHALVVLKNDAVSMMGVRPDILTMADARGDWRLVGQPDSATLKIDAYGIEPGTGQISYAPDLGPEGELKYPRLTQGRSGLRRPLIVFPCQPLSLFDLTDERYFETLQQLYIYDARTDSEPRTFGYELPVHSPPAKITGTVSASYVEPVAVVYAPRAMRVKVTMGMGLLGLRLILVNATPQTPEGEGFDPAATPRLVRTSYQAALDMWRVDEFRMQRQRGFGISSLRLDDLHGKAKQYLDTASAALQARDWAAHLAAARTAWAFEARAYPDVRGTESDTIKGVLFYLALLLPFAFFAERLLFAAPRIQDQILKTIAIFVVVYCALNAVHPAFRLLDTPWIILLGFVIMSLATLVIAIVSRRFNEELQVLQQAVSGQHTADVSRAGTLGAAFALGISNMRRRPLRTALTAVTLILLTFTVLSFTSVKTGLRSNELPVQTQVVYPGLLVRDPVWSALEQPTARILGNQFGRQGLVTARCWLVSSQLDKQLKLNIANAAGGGDPLVINAILGVTAEEPAVSGLGRQMGAGRWFRPGEQNVCIVPSSVAAKLKLQPTGEPGVFGRVAAFGSSLAVIGVLEDSALDQVVDLDGEPLTPVDFSKLEPEKLKMLTDQQAQKLKLGSVAPPPIDRYTHYAAEAQILLPFDRVMALGGTLRSVAVRFGDERQVHPAAKALMDRFELSAYGAGEGRVALYSSIGSTGVSGLTTVVIPLIIAALIVLNTMLGAVMERFREIGIFSSIGLAPAHVATLFLAESCVFANLGVILGYLLGQAVAKLVTWAVSQQYLGGLAGISLNYSSTATVGVAAIIIATVLLSSLYPARKAARAATPDVERRWRLPVPDGHVMRFRLPFMLTGRDGLACNTFLREYFDSYVDFAGGDFYCDRTDFAPRPGGGLRLAFTVWLAPYDLGVSQRVELLTIPEPDDPQVYAVDIGIERISGDDNGWRRTNWLFINILRQQFLIWRTVAPPQRAAYAERGAAALRGEVAA